MQFMLEFHQVENEVEKLSLSDDKSPGTDNVDGKLRSHSQPYIHPNLTYF
jgi:hypothetical protein